MSHTLDASADPHSVQGLIVCRSNVSKIVSILQAHGMKSPSHPDIHGLSPLEPLFATAVMEVVSTLKAASTPEDVVCGSIPVLTSHLSDVVSSDGTYGICVRDFLSILLPAILPSNSCAPSSTRELADLIATNTDTLLSSFREHRLVEVSEDIFPLLDSLSSSSPQLFAPVAALVTSPNTDISTSVLPELSPVRALLAAAPLVWTSVCLPAPKDRVSHRAIPMRALTELLLADRSPTDNTTSAGADSSSMTDDVAKEASLTAELARLNTEVKWLPGHGLRLRDDGAALDTISRLDGTVVPPLNPKVGPSPAADVEKYISSLGASSATPVHASTPTPAPTFTYSELFAGIGGFGQGLRALGGHCACAVEMERHARGVFSDNARRHAHGEHALGETETREDAVFSAHTAPLRDTEALVARHSTFSAQIDASRSSAPDAAVSAPSWASAPPTLVYSDVTLLPGVHVPQHNVLTAGFPCQPYSRLGSQPGLDDARKGQLILHVLRIAMHARPKLLFLENVPGLVSLQGGLTFMVILRAISRSGYRVAYHVIDAAAFVPQSRRRVYIIAVRDDLVQQSAVAGPEPAFAFPQLPPLHRVVWGSLEPATAVQPRHMLAQNKWTHICEQVLLKKGNWKLARPFDVSGTLVTSYRRGYNYNSQFVPIYDHGASADGISAALPTASLPTELVSSDPVASAPPHARLNTLLSSLVADDGHPAAEHASDAELLLKVAQRGRSAPWYRDVVIVPRSRPSAPSPAAESEDALEEAAVEEEEPVAPGIYAMPPRARFYTERECARLMGFPESFVLPGSRGPTSSAKGDAAKRRKTTPAAAIDESSRSYAMLGNAVCPPVIAAIAAAVLPWVGVLPARRGDAQGSLTAAAEAGVGVVAQACSPDELPVIRAAVREMMLSKRS